MVFESSLSRQEPLNSLTLRGEEGQTAVEYAMVMSLVGIVIATALALGLPDTFDAVWSTVTSAL
jgi:Flp pilus assembly pilin Flp